MAIPFTIPYARRTCQPAFTGDERPGREQQGSRAGPVDHSRRLSGRNVYASGSTASLSCFAMRALTTCLVGISMASPVAGLRPVRASRFCKTSFAMPGSVNSPQS